MILDRLRAVFEASAGRDFLVTSAGTVTYGAWLASVDSRREEVAPGDVVALPMTASADSVARLWQLWERGAIVGILPPGGTGREDHLRVLGGRDSHPLYPSLREAGHPGMVLFSSGTTGEPKAALHDAHRFLQKFAERRKDRRTLLFLPPDHVGGLDTLFYCMSNGSAVVVPDDRSPEAVCASVEAHGVEVLPANPSFLNLLLLQRCHERYDLRSLTTVTYGAEVMPQATLDRLAAALPRATLQQKYGSTEFGALRSSSRERGSLWVRLGGEGVETRVVDRMLEVRSPTTMLGYLNAPDPFAADGWVSTGDLVEQDGEYLRVLGRASELINVGGEKVHPAEVEGVVMGLAGVRDVLVFGEPNPLLGQTVSAEVVYDGPERGSALVALVKRHCREHLAAHKVPVRVTAVDALAMGAHKKQRRPVAAARRG